MQCAARVPIIFFFPIFACVCAIAHLAWSVPSAYFMYLGGSFDARLNQFDFLI